VSAANELIAALVAGGMDPAQAAGLIARAAVEMLGVRNQKSAGASRQQRYRERNKASLSVTRDGDEKRNETSQSVTSLRSDEASQTVTNRNESVTSDVASLSKEEKKEVIKKEKGEARGSRLPDNWEPPKADLEAAIEILGTTRADDELAKFRDHWKAQPGGKGVRADWPATWRNWYRRTREFGNRNVQSVSNHRTDTVAGRATAREAQQVATVGSAALRYLKEGNAARSGGCAPSGPDAAGFFDLGPGAKNAH
jgi:hypothetical protein